MMDLMLLSLTTSLNWGTVHSLEHSGYLINYSNIKFNLDFYFSITANCVAVVMGS